MNTPSDTRVVLEQYKLAVEMADRISRRRYQANRFFVSIVSALTVLNGSSLIDKAWHTAAVAGAIVSLCFLWRRLLITYRALNSAKFKVIHEMEKELPFAMFAQEQQYYKQPGYVSLTATEQSVPLLFAALSIVMVGATFLPHICACT